MDQGLIPRRYAKALYEVAAEQGKADALYAHMQKLEKAFADEPTLHATLNNPFVSDDDKSSLVMAAADAAPSDATFANMLRVLAANNRLGMVRDIAIAYMQAFRRANDIYRVRVTAAAPMAADEQERLKKVITDHLNGGKMEYEFDVDPSLIGGFVVDIDNERLDASVKNELKQLRLKLLSNKQ